MRPIKNIDAIAYFRVLERYQQTVELVLLRSYNSNPLQAGDDTVKAVFPHKVETVHGGRMCSGILAS